MQIAIGIVLMVASSSAADENNEAAFGLGLHLTESRLGPYHDGRTITEKDLDVAESRRRRNRNRQQQHSGGYRYGRSIGDEVLDTAENHRENPPYGRPVVDNLEVAENRRRRTRKMYQQGGRMSYRG